MGNRNADACRGLRAVFAAGGQGPKHGSVSREPSLKMKTKGGKKPGAPCFDIGKGVKNGYFARNVRLKIEHCSANPRQ